MLAISRQVRGNSTVAAVAVAWTLAYVLSGVCEVRWGERGEFAATAKHLVEMFKKNFVTFENHVDPEVRDAAPAAQIAAE